jgi:hypothetical protein
LETLWLLKQLGDVAHRNYPLVKMWRSHSNLLVQYGRATCLEWMDRGYEDNIYDQLEGFETKLPESKPTWLGDERLHASHRGRLLAKQPEWYSQFGWNEKPRKDYWWPLVALL